MQSSTGPSTVISHLREANFVMKNDLELLEKWPMSESCKRDIKGELGHDGIVEVLPVADSGL